MGETLSAEKVSFNGSVKIEARAERLSDNGGVILLREYAHRTGLIGWLGKHLQDPRKVDRIVHPLEELLQTILFLHAQGFEDQDDADRLKQDPAFRLGVSTRKGDAALRPGERGPTDDLLEPEGLPSQPTLSRLVRSLATEQNRAVLRMGLVEAVARRLAASGEPNPDLLTLDLDLLPIKVEGQQKGSKYNGYYRERIYLALVTTIAETGDLVDVQLREGTSHAKEDFEVEALGIIRRVEERLGIKVSLRMDAGFPCEETLRPLEEVGCKYVSRLRNNTTLKTLNAAYPAPEFTEPVPTGEEARVWIQEAGYRADTWGRFRRVVLVTQEQPGELYCNRFWLVTNWSEDEMSGRELLEHYRRRGKAEGHMGEWISTLHPRLSSTFRFKDHYREENITNRYSLPDPFAQNEVILLLSALAYSLMHGLRALMNKDAPKPWSIRKVREKLLRVATRVLLHARQVHVVVTTQAAEHWRVLLEYLTGIPALV